MSEKPILFSGPMVQAILDGRKTMTRRVVKRTSHTITEWERLKSAGMVVHQKDSLAFGEVSCSIEKCPYGKPGDLLWVRETWADFCPMWNGAWCGHGTQEGIIKEHRPVYRADGKEGWPNGEPGRWTPSIHMPRWASRLTLRIKSVRAEQLQDIAEEDIIAEGVTVDRVAVWINKPWHEMPTLHSAWYAFWDHINGARGYLASSNPWCWCIEFEVVPQEAIK